MGLAMLVDVVAIADSSILKVNTTPVTKVVLKGVTTGNGTVGIAVAHYGSNNMIAFRYKLKNVPMKIVEKSFTADGTDFPAGSFVIADMTQAAAVKAAVEEVRLHRRRDHRRPPRCSRCTTPIRRASRSTRSGTTRRTSAGTGRRSTISTFRTT